jgi:hypothetical protein
VTERDFAAAKSLSVFLRTPERGLIALVGRFRKLGRRLILLSRGAVCPIIGEELEIEMKRIAYSWFAMALIACVLADVAAAQRNPEPSVTDALTIGKTVVKLGASKDSLIPAISFEYAIKPMFPNCTQDLAACRAYNIVGIDNFPLGFLEFDKRDNLVKASVELLQGPNLHSEGEVGKAVVSAIARLVSEGQKCSLDASTRDFLDTKTLTPDPESGVRQATIECGRKRIRISYLKLRNGSDSMQLTEEVGCPKEVVGACQE